MSAEGQRALARLFGFDPDPDAPPADPAPTGLEWIDGAPFAASEQPPPEDDTPPEFDGGPRQLAPDPDGDHSELLKNLLAPRDPGAWP